MPLPKILNLPMPMEEQMKTISALMKPFLFDRLRFNWRKIKKRELAFTQSKRGLTRFKNIKKSYINIDRLILFRKISQEGVLLLEKNQELKGNLLLITSIQNILLKGIFNNKKLAKKKIWKKLTLSKRTKHFKFIKSKKNQQNYYQKMLNN